MFYLGSHHGREDDGYVCSSAAMMKEYKERPEDFKRRIIGRNYYNNRQLTLMFEWCWLGYIKADEFKRKYYNRTRTAAGWPEMTDEVRRARTEKAQFTMIINGGRQKWIAAGQVASANLTVEQRRVAARKRETNMTQEARSARAVKANNSRTPEQRSQSVRRGRAKMTPLQRRLIAIKGNITRGFKIKCKLDEEVSS